MKLMKKDIKANTQITTFFSLESMSLRRSKTGQNFLAVELHDKSGKINGYIWKDPVVMAASLTEKSFVKIQGIINNVNNSLSINISRIRKAEKHEIDIRDFLEVVSGGVELWQEKLNSAIALIHDENCRKLISAFLEDESFLEQFITSPAGISVHHNYVGGLLEHTVNVMNLAAMIADNNPALIDKDLLITASFLHDIGKTKELYWEIAKEYTTEGKLLGHISIGFLMLQEKLAMIKNFPERLALLLKHMILSHHGSLEYGSPIKPALPEAVVLNLIDNIDAKINHIYCYLGASDPKGEWSRFDKILNTEICQLKYKRQTANIMEKAA
ncbi:MAG: HD domain-containing protein [Nitrospirae bacterium]|nr:HD domain-containing protein [Nitrospirota bacterium]